jgi:hypothetical protein
MRRPAVVVAALFVIVLSGPMARLSAQGEETLGQVKAGADIVKAVIDIIKAVNTARSVVLEVDNNTNFKFRRVSDHHAHGGWAKPPSNEIGPKSSDVFGSQSTGGSVMTGTEGEAAYTNGEGLQFTIRWNNPWAGGNHCDVAVSGPQSDLYRVKASCGSGDKGAHMRYEAYRSDWKRLPGCARDIGVDASGVAWVIACTGGSGPGNFTIRRWTGHDWEPINGGGVRIAVEPGGTPWLLNSEGKVYKRSGNGWGSPLPGCARDIGIDQSGTAWVVGCTGGSGPGNLTIRRWNGNGWTPVSGGGLRIAVEPGGTPWLVNSQGKIYRRSGDLWGDPLPGCANDIGVDAKGHAWVVGCSTVGIGYSIHRWNEGQRSWSLADGSAIAIAVEANGRPWVVNASQEIYVRDKKDF